MQVQKLYPNVVQNSEWTNSNLKPLEGPQIIQDSIVLSGYYHLSLLGVSEILPTKEWFWVLGLGLV